MTAGLAGARDDYPPGEGDGDSVVSLSASL